jgi:hypothetical protein
LDKCLNSATDDYNYYAHDDYLVEAVEGLTISEFHCARESEVVPYPEGWIVQEYDFALVVSNLFFSRRPCLS